MLDDGVMWAMMKDAVVAVVIGHAGRAKKRKRKKRPSAAVELAQVVAP
jgi:hypothetical protein